MQHDSKAYLSDIQAASARILDFAANRSMEELKMDILFKSAVERQFEIAGEALNRLDRYFPEIAGEITNVRKIVDFRNLLTHGYDIIGRSKTIVKLVLHSQGIY